MRGNAKRCRCQSRVSLDGGVERKEGVDDDRRREASLVTSAMLGSAIMALSLGIVYVNYWHK